MLSALRTARRRARLPVRRVPPADARRTRVRDRDGAQDGGGELETAWFERHGSTPITELPAHWPEPYRRVVERRIELIESEPEHRADRAAGVQAPLERRAVGASRQSGRCESGCWIGSRSRSYWSGRRRSRRVASWPTACGATPSSCRWRAVSRPGRLRRHGAGRRTGRSDAVPFLPVLRYKPIGPEKA